MGGHNIMLNKKKIFNNKLSFIIVFIFLINLTVISASEIILEKTSSIRQVQPGEWFSINVKVTNNFNESIDAYIFEKAPSILEFKDHIPYQDPYSDYIMPYISIHKLLPANSYIEKNLTVRLASIGTFFISKTILNTETATYTSNPLEITVMCNQNHICESNLRENYETCSQDCPSGSQDGICDMIKDGKNDPDCLQGYDPDYKNPHCTNGIRDEGELDVDCGLICNEPCFKTYCTHNSDCQSNYCNTYESVCTDGTAGARCYNDNECESGICISEPTYNHNNPSGMICSNGNVGDPCTYEEDCKSKRCDGICLEPSIHLSEIGDSCTDHSDCNSNICDPINNTCSYGEVGSGCTNSSHCEGYCYIYEGYYSNNKKGRCTNGTAGSECNENSGCIDNYCVNFRCSGGNLGSECRVGYGDCDYACDPYSNTCTEGTVGSYCTDIDAYDCLSYYCDNNVCAEQPGIKVSDVISSIDNSFNIVIGSTAVKDNIASIDIAGFTGIQDTLDDNQQATSNDYIVVVGGPCVNKRAAELLGLTYPTCGASSGIPENKGLIQTFTNDGKKQILIAGWESINTRMAAQAVVRYSEFENEMDEDTVIVSGTSLDDINVE